MFMPAFETLAGIAEQQRTGRHQFATTYGRAVLKAARRNDCDREAGVPLFEWAILRTGGAHDILHGPTVALSDPSRRCLTNSPIQRAPRQSVF
jgi:hypothetical protein